jgi:hypothetical protein
MSAILFMPAFGRSGNIGSPGPLKAHDVKLFLAIICAVLIGRPAIAADLELKCKGSLVDPRRPVRTTKIEFVVSITDREVTFKIAPKYLGGAPIPPVVKLAITKADGSILEYETGERRPSNPERPRAFGVLSTTRPGSGFVWVDDDGGFWGVISGCEFLVGARTTISPKVT